MQRKASARHAYPCYVETGVSAGRRSELGGGGLIRGMGGWDTVKKAAENGCPPKRSLRGIGHTKFGVQYLENVNERLSRQSTLHARGMDLNGVVALGGKRLIYGAETPSCARTKHPRAF